MDKEHLKGAAKEVEGKTKQAIGKVTGDNSMKAKGKADELEGKARKMVGDAKDAIKGK